jgi:multiple antibiotic resistance protein
VPIDRILELSLFLLAMINPVSKVAILAALSQSHTRRELASLSVRATAVGLVLLIAFAFAGQWVLSDVFRVHLYSIRLAGGAAIFLVGMRALREGQFFTFSTESSLQDLSAAPLGMPMIAGPATIAQVIAAASTQSPWIASAAVIPAMAVNLAVMLVAARYAQSLKKTHFLGPLVRIVGLFVAAIGAEMALGGLGDWLAQMHAADAAD